MKERDRLPRQHSTNSIKHNHLLLSMIEEAQHARRPVISMGNAFMVNYYNLNSMAAIIIIPLPTKFSQTISVTEAQDQPLIQASPGSILIAQSITTYKTFRDG